jgi:hypothetical protein
VTKDSGSEHFATIYSLLQPSETILINQYKNVIWKVGKVKASISNFCDSSFGVCMDLYFVKVEMEFEFHFETLQKFRLRKVSTNSAAAKLGS